MDDISTLNLKRLEEIFGRLGIGFKEYLHPKLNSCSDANLLGIKRCGARTKHLFLRDNPGKRHYLLVTSPNKQIDLKKLSRHTKISRLGFASEQRLKKFLGISPGCVSLLSLCNDPNNKVEVIIDEQLWGAEKLQFHPLVNSKTWVIRKVDIQKWMCFMDTEFTLMKLPEMKKIGYLPEGTVIND